MTSTATTAPETARTNAVRRLLAGINAKDVSVMDELFADDAVMHWPQSGERVVGAENRRSVYGAFPSLPAVTPRRILERGDLVVLEATFDYGGGPESVFEGVLLFEFSGSLITRETAYWAAPFAPAEWRAAWVEIDPR